MAFRQILENLGKSSQSGRKSSESFLCIVNILYIDKKKITWSLGDKFIISTEG